MPSHSKTIPQGRWETGKVTVRIPSDFASSFPRSNQILALSRGYYRRLLK
jgi:hypothetical protein